MRAYDSNGSDGTCFKVFACSRNSKSLAAYDIEDANAAAVQVAPAAAGATGRSRREGDTATQQLPKGFVWIVECTVNAEDKRSFNRLKQRPVRFLHHWHAVFCTALHCLLQPARHVL